MKSATACIFAAITMCFGASAAFAAELKDQMKVQIDSSEAHSGLQPGTYVATISGPLIKQVKNEGLTVVAVTPKP